MLELDNKYRELADRARAVAEEHEDVAADADAMLVPHEGVRAALRESELPRLAVTSEYGGADERIDSLAITIVREQLMGVSAHMDGLFGMQGIGSFALSVAGSDAVRRAWLPKVATLDAIAALALTEPDVGSDLRAVTTTVRHDDGQLVVDGDKSFITNAASAAFYTVLCREADHENGDYSLVLVPADTPGVVTEVGPSLIAPHVMGAVSFRDARVPEDHRIGEPGQGFRLMLSTLATFRVSVAGAAVGLAQAALAEAVHHTQSREQFGQKLAALGPIPHYLGGSWAEVEAARALTYQAARAATADPFAALDQSSMAKVVATETAATTTDRAVQVMGRFGLIAGSKIERLYRNARPMRIYEGGNEVLTGQLAKRLAKRYAL